MLSYFRYIELNLIKKKTTWVAAGVFWLYMAIILIIVPAALHLNPDVLWTTSLFDIKSFTIVILSILCAVLTVVIFRDPLEDGSELIIVSKPTSRAKLISVKIICYLLHSLLILLTSMVIMAFMYCFGQKSVTNTAGVDFATIPKMEGGLFLGGMVVILLFGGIAIIVNGVFNKIGILVITIGVAVVLNIINMVVPFVTTTPDKYISRTYKNTMDSSRYIDINGNFHNSVYSENNYFDGNDYYGTEYYAKQGIKKTNGAFPSYINAGSQISDIFNAFTTNEEFDDTANAFGEDYTYKYSLRTDGNSNQVTPILKYRVDGNEEFNFDPAKNTLLPNIAMSVSTRNYKSEVIYNVPGMGADERLLYSLLGIKDDAVACYRPNTDNLFKNINRVKFYSGDDIYNLPEADTEEIDRAIGVVSYNPLPPFDTPPTLIQQFYHLWDDVIDIKENPRFFRSIIASDLLGKTTVLNPEGENNYFFDGDKLGIHIGVKRLEEENVSQAVINQVNDAIDAAYIKLVLYIQMSLERQLWTWISDYFSSAPFNDESMTYILTAGPLDYEPALKIQWLNWLINDITHVEYAPFDYFTNRPLQQFTDSLMPQDIYWGQTYEATSGSKADCKFHLFSHKVYGTDCLADTYLYDAHRYYTASSVTLFWGVFAMLLFVGAVIIYLKTDFK